MMSYKELYKAIKNCMYDRPCRFCSQHLHTSACIEDVLKRLADVLGVVVDDEE